MVRSIPLAAVLAGSLLVAACGESTPTPTPAPVVTPTTEPTPTQQGQGLSTVLISAQDATLFEEPEDGANGSGQHLFAGNTAQGVTRRALVRFDVADDIPAGATITGVTLTMQMSRTRGSATPVTLHRLTASWGEGSSDAAANEGRGTDAAGGDATWVHRFTPDETWESPGGDFVADPSGTTEVFRSGPYMWESTAGMVNDVQRWLDDPSTNYGWLLKGDETASRTAKRFDSREHTSEAQRPTLTVSFTAP